MKLTFSQYLTRVALAKEANPSWRMGQTYFNVLQDIDLSLAERTSTTHLDPYYDDKKIGDFLSHIYAVGEWAK